MAADSFVVGVAEDGISGWQAVNITAMSNKAHAVRVVATGRGKH